MLGHGLLATLSLGHVISFHPDLRLLLLTGFLGSYTTFSSYVLDSVKLLSQRDLQADLIYWTGSVLLGFISLQLGVADSRYEPTSLGIGAAFKFLQNHTAIQQRLNLHTLGPHPKFLSQPWATVYTHLE